MTTRDLLCAGAAVVGLVAIWAAWPGAGPSAQQVPPAVQIDADDTRG